jgi:hypothetical protein
VKVRIAATMIAALAMAGCGGAGAHVAASDESTGNWQQRLSAGVLGCRPGHIEISELYEDVVDTWIASCAGRTVVCGWVRGASVSCADLRE